MDMNLNIFSFSRLFALRKKKKKLWLSMWEILTEEKLISLTKRQKHDEMNGWINLLRLTWKQRGRERQKLVQKHN